MRKAEMTEKAYIVASDLARLRCVIQLLYDIHPTVNDAISLDEMHEVQGLLAKWESELENSFDVIA